MTPEAAKAKELVDKFRYSRHDDHEEMVAKQCATMCVQEIQTELLNVEGRDTIIVSDEKEWNVQARLDYWEYVKSEIKSI